MGFRALLTITLLTVLLVIPSQANEAVETVTDESQYVITAMVGLPSLRSGESYAFGLMKTLKFALFVERAGLYFAPQFQIEETTAPSSSTQLDGESYDSFSAMGGLQVGYQFYRYLGVYGTTSVGLGQSYAEDADGSTTTFLGPIGSVSLGIQGDISKNIGYDIELGKTYKLYTYYTRAGISYRF